VTGALLALLLAPLAWQPDAGTKVEVRGTIEKVQIVAGQGSPSLQLKCDKATYRVTLGSMRYLMEKNFNPKSGQTAVVRGVLNGDTLMAYSVELPADKLVLPLRDEQGMPLWRGGGRRR
jgi:hypothetical protein